MTVGYPHKLNILILKYPKKVNMLLVKYPQRLNILITAASAILFPKNKEELLANILRRYDK